MMRTTRWLTVLLFSTALLTQGACGEKKAEGEATEEGAEANSDASTEEASDATEGDKAKSEAPTGDKASDVVEAEKTPEGASVAKEGESAPAPGEQAAKEKLAEMGPEKEAEVSERCGKAFDNTIFIMKNAGAPPQILEQMRNQRDKTVASCLEQAKIDPSGGKMIECMLAARLPADIQTCTRKFGNIKPIKPPKGVPVGHDDH